MANMKGSEAKLNRAAEEQPRSGHKPPARAAGVGNETKANMRGAQDGNPTDGMHGGSSLKGAMSELRSQHPTKHDDRGPHHGEMGKRHEPLHGMRVGR